MNNRITLRRDLMRLCSTLVLALAVNVGNVSSQDAAAQDLHTVRELDRAIKNAETLLKKYPKNDFTPNLMFQLSELYLKRSALKFQQQMLIYEDAEEQYRQGLLTDEPDVPGVDFSQAIEVSVALLEKYPTIHFRDKVFYRVALCYSEEGNQDQAAQYFVRLTNATEDQALLEEAYFRLGEYYFDRGDYKKTIDYYGRLLNGWDSQFFDMALYKLGWAYYNVQNYRKAIDTFISLLEDIKSLNQSDMAEVGAAKADLRTEAIQYVAICFAESAGAAGAERFLAEKKDEPYSPDILSHLAHLYRDRNYYDDAIKTLNVLLRFYPDRPDAASFQEEIVKNYDLAGNKARADTERSRFLEMYGPGSMWLEGIRNDDEKKQVLRIAEEFLYSLGTEAQARAQTAQDSTEYGCAIGHYSSYMEKFPDSKRADKVQFYLAECYYEIGAYDKAADSYYAVLINYPQSEFCETASYNRLLAYNKLYAADASLDSTDIILANFAGIGNDTVTTVNAHQAQLLQASNDFVTYYPDSPKSNEVLMTYAQIFYDLERFDLAKPIYAKVVARLSENPFLTQAYLRMAQCEFKEENFEEAESWYQQLALQFPDSTRIVKKATKMIASSRFRMAEANLASGDTLRAAEGFENVVNTVQDSAIAERALFEAAKQYENLHQRIKAISLYEEMLTRFPKSKLVDESLFKAGLLSEEVENWQRAASNYLKLYQHDRFSQYAARGLFLAAKCYEADKQWDLARKYYGEYTEAYLQDADRFLEAAFRKGEIAFNQRHYRTAIADLEFVISSYRKFVRNHVQVDNYLAANAQFLIAEVSMEKFKDVRLTPPLERKLKRKRALFQKTVKAYTAAAKFKVAEWTTASSYKIGLAFEAFGDALLASPRPQNLSPEDMKRYDQKLWQRVLPFKEKAQQTYEANVNTAHDNHITNNWVTESEKRLQALNMELGLSSINLGDDSGL